MNEFKPYLILKKHEDGSAVISCNIKDYDNNCDSGDFINKCKKCNHSVRIRWRCAEYENSGLTPERVAELAATERDGRLAVLPYQRGDRIYILDNKVRGSIRTTRLESYLVYTENPVRVYIKCTANSLWHDISNVFPTREEAKAALAAQKH